MLTTAFHCMEGIIDIPSPALHALAQELPSSPHGCTDGSCYPATGNLLIGRAVNLTSTSTCGLETPEQYCIVSHLQQSEKCFTCDSRRPYDSFYQRSSHRVENVIYLRDSSEDLTWWQSVNGEESVSLRLNLETEFHFTHLIMKFKTFRPAGMLIERSVDFGRSWKPYRYFAYNCSRTFPGVRTRSLRFINDVICEERYSDIEPSTEGEVIFKVLDPAIPVSNPYSPNIQDLLRITNLRINFTKLHTLGDNLLDRRIDVLQKYYYSVYELVVRGSCFCYGHASECAPVPGVHNRDSGMIHGRCVCKHNTVGLNCEQCKDFYYDLPWKPAEANDPHTCRECNCNGHSNKCHFDMAVYLATGNVSGGVCDDCLHNTMGRNCETCKPFFYQDPARDIRDPHICVRCDCDPVGSLDGGRCDSHTDIYLGMVGGQCRCKPNVQGQRCDHCKDGHYGLSQNDPLGCQCECRMENGQCDCRPHLIDRQCSAVELGYFCAALDYLTYEAETAVGYSPDSADLPGKAKPAAITNCAEHLSNQLRRHRRHRHITQQQKAALRRIRQLQQTPDVTTAYRERYPDQMVTWTGPGFARVKDGAGLVFTIEDIPYAMEYDIMIRYEPESTENWEAIVSVTSLLLSSSTRCGNLLPTEQLYTVTLMHNKRHILMPQSFCFEPDNRYVVAIRFQRHEVSHRHQAAHILADSLVLIPRYDELPGFTGNGPQDVQRREEMVHYMCLDSFMVTPMPSLAEICVKLICSISFLMHNGALPCHCDPQGSLSVECKKIGGQCQCKPNVIGRRCDQCAPRTYGFGPYGCTACDCHRDGSDAQQCDPVTGQCPCKPGAFGRQCSECQHGHWGFPNCRPCQCNGHSETCDPQTGMCLDCRENTAGHLCERCINGYYGNAVLGSGEHCRPCACPGNLGSGHLNADSCHIEHSSNQIICQCKPGYTGQRCDRCAPGYYGNPEQINGKCWPCECNGNIVAEDPESCDPQTGQCLKCLYNTDGPSCSECKPGYYGNALARDCRRCTCMRLGTDQEYCSNEGCYCDRQTGACPCRPNVINHNCDQCAANHWHLGMDDGCEACGCHPQNSLSLHCNLLSGQCHCRPGFGGKQCTECEMFHWGDPAEYCEECKCDSQGSVSGQCDRITGACACKEWAAGQHCKECARGFTGDFSRCVPCHPCFQLWDDIVCQLKHSIDRIRFTISKILELGEVPGVTNTRIKELEQKLAEIQKLLQDRDADRMYQLINQITDDLRAEIAVTDGRLMEAQRDLNVTTEHNNILKHNLTSLEQEFGDLNTTLNRWKDELTNYISGGISDLLNKVQKYYQESLAAEQRCNASVYGAESPVAQSRHTRNITEVLLDQTKDKFMRNVTARKKSLSELKKKAEDLEGKVNHLSQKAMSTLDKAKKKKELFEKSNKKLKDFIRTIKDFLTEEGADPESIEKVAQQVLAITLPVNLTTLESLVMQIKDGIANLTDLDGVFNYSSEQVAKVKKLLDRAISEQEKSQGINDVINKTKEAINTSLEAIEKARTAVEEALENLNSTQSVTAMVENKLSNLEANLMDMMMRLTNLSQQVDILKIKTEQNRKQANEAKAIADNATQTAFELTKNLSHVEKRYKELKDKIDDLGGTAMGNITQKAQDMKNEAENLLKKVNKDMETLKKMERKLQKNEQKMQQQRDELAQLEGNVTEIRDFIREKVTSYNTCLVTTHAQEPDHPHGCTHGSCYPATGDLLVGREKNLKASSTCGLTKREPYCIVSHLQEEKKCFQCDSRRPYHSVYNTISHRIENVITSFKPDHKKRWWQSENGRSDVYIQLDLEAEFHFTHLIMTFKTFRPAAMLIERSADFGRTWQMYRYFAHDCASVYPGISQGPLRNVDDLICESRYSDIEPSSEGEVIFRVLDPAIRIEDPYSARIQNQLKITNLRVNFTKLHTLGDNLLDSRVEIKEKYYYALYELVVRGNCFCYGHASECAPIDGIRDDIEGMVHGRCVCKHNTKGLNCEQCDDLHNDLPWKPAEGRNSNACKKCNCNGHSNECHFDMAVYLATGNVSGGVCDNCLHNTMGRNCETCKSFFYQDPARDIRDPHICVACNCDSDGSVNGGVCDGHDDPTLGMIAGQCRCKENVEGHRCDRCKSGFFGLSANDPQGCQPCRCDPRGTVSGGPQCDPVQGNCFCKRMVTGRTCNQCLPEHWALSHDASGCRACECDVGGAVDNQCSVESGQCRCRNHMIGRQCNQVETGYFFMALDYYTYEAELAKLGQGCTLEEREWQSGQQVSWTGTGFVRVPEGSTLEFFINNIPYSMEYDVLIRYEPQMPQDWQEVRIKVIRPGSIPTSSPCGNTIPADDLLTVSLPSGSRFIVLPRSVCLERGVSYTLHLEFISYADKNNIPGFSGANILIDSIALLPHYNSLDMFVVGDPASNLRKQSYERYHCHESANSVSRPAMGDVCAKLLLSMSAIINNGALPCQCDPQGSVSSQCEVRGGQCLCRPNVIGRRCDRCAPGSFGFGPAGCKACECNQEGSRSQFCDQHTGQCSCLPGAFSRRCDGCQAGHWGFPNCRLCQCNGHTEDCHQRTGVCLNCRDRTAGDQCERCANGYYGNPVLGSGGRCQPCPCPDGPDSGRHFAASCYEDNHSRQVVCNCKQGYTGARCEDCAPGYYGNPSQPGGRCQPCRCSNNIDLSDPESCDRRTGECLKCLYNTEGPECAVCKSGYYGEASRRNCRKCTCNFLGTERSQCLARDDCLCQRATGQCQCLPNVIGLTCDHCAPNYWNLASGHGCQCQCRDGFGGKTCRDCQENFWGDPRILCRACDCDSRGIETSQCDRLTGHCACRQGVSGVRCDQCARGFSGTFPACQPCHQCFGDWDRIVQDLAARTKALVARAQEIQTTGLTGAYEMYFKKLEEKLAQAQDIVNARNATAEAVTNLMGMIEYLRTRIGETTDTLTQLEGDLTTVQDSNYEASNQLSSLEREARELDLSSERLNSQLDILKNSNFLGAYDSIRASYNKSRDAERRTNQSTTDTPSTVSQSADTRRKTERLMTKSKDDFNRKNAANKRALTDLNAKVQNLDIRKINEKVCGAPGHVPCSESPCGGVDCRDDERRHCGGLNCNGAAAVADNALERSKHAEKELIKAMEEVEDLFKQVADAKAKAQEAKDKAQAALIKASDTKNKVERSNNDLRDLIKQIRAFLMQEGADPDSIEAVANQVLKLSIPASPQQIRHLADEIKDRVRSLSNVDAILDKTQGDVRKAEQLLIRARNAKNKADKVKNTADSVNQALDGARKAQAAAEKAILRARDNIGMTENRLAQIQSETSASENDLNDAMNKLRILEQQIEALKAKQANNIMVAARAKDTAAMAQNKANSAKQDLDGELTDKYRSVQDLVGRKASAVQDAKNKAERLRDEAKQLLKDAQDKLHRLAELEKDYEENQKTLQTKARQLDGLEDKMKLILDAINKQIQIYNTCHTTRFCSGSSNTAKIAGPGRKRRSSDSDPSESGSGDGSEVRDSRPVSGKWLKMASSSSSSFALGEASRRRVQRGAEESSSSSKKKQKDRANQESREAKRAATAANQETKKDVFLDWKQNADEVIVRLRCGEGALKVENIDTAFSDTACQVRLPDGREWSCHLHAEIESSCSKVVYKEKGSILQLVMQKKIPFNDWPMLRNNKEADPVNLLRENKSSHKSEHPENSSLSSEPLKASSRPEQQSPVVESKFTKPERGVKRGMKYKQLENTSASVSETKTGNKGDKTPEPTARKTVRPSKNAKEPSVASSPAQEHQLKPVVNGKPLTSSASALVSSTARDTRSEPQTKKKEGAQKDKELEKKTDRHIQVEAGTDKDHRTVCEPRAEPHEPSAPRVIPSTSEGTCKCEETSRGGNASGDREKNKEQGRNAGAVLDQRQTNVPAHHMESGDAVPTIDSKRQEIKITEEEKRDRSKEEPCEKSVEKNREPMVNVSFVKNDWYEKGTDLMVVNVYLKEICREISRVLFREQDFTLIFQTRNLIQPEQCGFSFTPLRIDITLRKRHSQRWGGLEAQVPQGAVGGAKVAVSSGPSSLDKSQPGSSQHPLPAKEEPRAGEEKPKTSRTPEESALDVVAPRSVSDHVAMKQEPAIIPPKPTCMVQPMTHAPSAASDRPEEEEEKKVCLPGFTGLVNLGNTCFMNSVIQSLSNTRELRDYFHDRAFETEINCNNPLGTGGRLAIGFAVLLRALWKGTHHAFQPSKLKAIVASKASQFTGYAQHDAQEFMAFLLDGLHEDLNRIQNKPYTETVDSDGRQDEVVAEEAWQRHKMRNDSFIVDLFQGQYKSKLVCPMCSKVSITFDPFLYLPVPLPQKQKVLTVFYFAKEPHKKPVKFLVSVSKESSSTAEVLESISRSVRVKPENLRLAEVVKKRFHRIFLPSHSLDTVSSTDMLFCFEVLSKELTKEKVVLLRVQQRLQVPSIPIAKCAACQKPPLSDDEKLRRCTRCYRVGYCNQACQKNHWPNHKALCRPNSENVGLPFLISVPESRLTYTRLSQLLEGYSRYSVNVFRPPFQSGRTSPEASLSRADHPIMTGSIAGAPGTKEEEPYSVEEGDTQEQGRVSPEMATAQASSYSEDMTSLCSHTTDSGFSELLSSSHDSLGEKETSCEKAVKPEAAVTGYQQPSECSYRSGSQFYISLQDANNKELKLEDKGDGVLEVPEDCTLELVWKNNERLKEYVLVRSKELEFDEDPSSASETARAGHFTLEQCLNLFTKPEVLAPEEAWYCPKCQQHREASKQLLLWRLPNVLIIQLKRFSFRSFIWRDKINDMVDFPVRNLDLSKFCIGQKEDAQQPPIYDLYAVINHYGGMIGGHYTAYARLPSDKNSQRSDVGWRLFDDSTVTTVEESQVVTRYAYVLFYRRRNSPVERPPRLLGPLGAESPAAAGAAATQASSQALFGTDLDAEGPPQLGAEVTSDLFARSAECSGSSYTSMEEVD
ncbi:Laminin subunit beta-2 [Bagarius yarrelli]|uniref:Laminin subunit beta-2 n=1 Tax=Bagarius yarrelli TaxID=175774 RepID=A0A556U2E0_BAGYA|nr:Laminin subunit beta-2 [Bagarius yarrelli]